MNEEQKKETSGVKYHKTTHEFFVAGVKFHQLDLVAKDISEGNYLLLVPESSNKFDPNAIRIEYATFEKQFMLGYVPKKFSSEVTAMIEVGKRVGCYLAKYNVSAKPWEKLKVEIREML